MKPFRAKKPGARAGRPPSRPAAARPAQMRPAPTRSAATRPDEPRRHQAKTEEMFHGLRACEALFARRAADVIRVYVTEARKRQFAKLLDWCARERKGFQIVADESCAADRLDPP